MFDGLFGLDFACGVELLDRGVGVGWGQNVLVFSLGCFGLFGMNSNIPLCGCFSHNMCIFSVGWGSTWGLYNTCLVHDRVCCIVYMWVAVVGLVDGFYLTLPDISYIQSFCVLLCHSSGILGC